MRNKIFKIKYANGKYHYIVSYKGWYGLTPFAESINVDYQEAISIREASMWELIKYIIKGGNYE